MSRFRTDTKNVDLDDQVCFIKTKYFLLIVIGLSCKLQSNILTKQNLASVGLKIMNLQNVFYDLRAVMIKIYNASPIGL